jgi:hypothetical protein
MYVKVPEHLKTPLLAELRQLKLRSSVKYFPVLVLIFSAIVILIVLVKGFGLLRMLSEYTNLDISNTTFIIVSLSVIVCGTAGILAFSCGKATVTATATSAFIAADVMPWISTTMAFVRFVNRP